MKILSWLDQYPLLAQMGFVIVSIVLVVCAIVFVKNWIKGRKNNK